MAGTFPDYPDLGGGAACKGADTEAFFSADPEQQAVAIAICRVCPAVRNCLTYALERDVAGIWGGTTAAQRRDVRRRHSITATPIVSDEPREEPA
jgi:WhiB family transcriptional regulator, redox-sensing transcriptional regulator